MFKIRDTTDRKIHNSLKRWLELGLKAYQVQAIIWVTIKQV